MSENDTTKFGYYNINSLMNNFQRLIEKWTNEFGMVHFVLYARNFEEMKVVNSVTDFVVMPVYRNFQCDDSTETYRFKLYTNLTKYNCKDTLESLKILYSINPSLLKIFSITGSFYNDDLKNEEFYDERKFRTCKYHTTTLKEFERDYYSSKSEANNCFVMVENERSLCLNVEQEVGQFINGREPGGILWEFTSNELVNKFNVVVSNITESNFFILGFRNFDQFRKVSCYKAKRFVFNRTVNKRDIQVPYVDKLRYHNYNPYNLIMNNGKPIGLKKRKAKKNIMNYLRNNKIVMHFPNIKTKIMFVDILEDVPLIRRI